MIPENTVPPPEMVGMITTIVVKVNPEREDSETRTVSIQTENAVGSFGWFCVSTYICRR